MKNISNVSKIQIVTVGLAIFSMFFGAGNLMYPIKVGINSGSRFVIGMFAFIITSVILPLLGLISMILFEGDYKAFLYRIGKIPGYLLLVACMLIIGPIIALPRIVTLSYTMMAPFMPGISLLIFTILFLGVTFLCTFRESKIVDLLGKFISPALIVSLIIIIFKGLLFYGTIVNTMQSSSTIFKTNFWLGYETLDLLGGIFFSSIILNILKGMFVSFKDNSNKLAYIALKSGLIGVGLLALIYIGLGLIGMLHGWDLNNAAMNTGELFRDISFKILGSYGAAVIATAVFMACLSTAIALSAVVAEFVQRDILYNKISFVNSLLIVLISSMPLSFYGLGTILKLTGGPILYIGYPILIAITLLNISYKLFGFKPIKIPVLIVGLAALVSYII